MSKQDLIYALRQAPLLYLGEAAKAQWENVLEELSKVGAISDDDWDALQAEYSDDTWVQNARLHR